MSTYSGDHNEFLNTILGHAPESWDQDTGADAIAIDYVRFLESEVQRLGGSLERPGHEPYPMIIWTDSDGNQHTHALMKLDNNSSIDSETRYSETDPG